MRFLGKNDGRLKSTLVCVSDRFKHGFDETYLICSKHVRQSYSLIGTVIHFLGRKERPLYTLFCEIFIDILLLFTENRV